MANEQKNDNDAAILEAGQDQDHLLARGHLPLHHDLPLQRITVTMSLLYHQLIPTPKDSFTTPTSEEQEEVEQNIGYFINEYQRKFKETAAIKSNGSSKEKEKEKENSKQTHKLKRVPYEHVPIAKLNKAVHLAFTRRVLDPLPSTFVGFDSTRCWLIYWVAHSHALMGSELDDRLRTHAIATLVQFQHPVTGGFGGGNGQVAHLMGTYASIMALAIVGGPGPCPNEDDVALGVSVQIGKGGWDAIDRVKMYTFLLSLKQPDGSFTVHRDGETDVRATYCVVCIALMLGIATPELFQGVGQAIANCQTYEGGLCAASQPFGQRYADVADSISAAALGEAHGGYAYCAMAAHLALSLLPNPTTPSKSPLEQNSWEQSRSASSAALDVENVARWAAQQQGIAIEGGGFRGRTNKLVDGCYGWFTGAGLGTVLAAQLELRHGRQWWDDEEIKQNDASTTIDEDGDSNEWENISANGSSSNNVYVDVDEEDGVLFDRVALQEYILAVAQAPRGGLRDKPAKNADVYHTCYNLSGLSLCQHRVMLDYHLYHSTSDAWKQENVSVTTQQDAWRKACFAAMMSWSVDPKYTCIVGASENRVGVTHPIYNVPLAKARAMMQWSYAQR